MTDRNDEEIKAFARAFQQFMGDVHALAADPTESRLAAAIRAHLGTDPDELPVVEETFPAADHPNVQLALQSIAEQSPGWQLFGLPVDALHWAGFGLTNLAARLRHHPEYRESRHADDGTTTIDRVRPGLSK